MRNKETLCFNLGTISLMKSSKLCMYLGQKVQCSLPQLRVVEFLKNETGSVRPKDSWMWGFETRHVNSCVCTELLSIRALVLIHLIYSSQLSCRISSQIIICILYRQKPTCWTPGICLENHHQGSKSSSTKFPSLWMTRVFQVFLLLLFSFFGQPSSELLR